MRALSVLGLACAVLGLLSGGCKRSQPEEGTISGSLSFGGKQRTFVYNLPNKVSESPAQLIIGLHGNGGNGVGQEHLSFLTDVIGDENRIAVYPDGIDKSWADGRGTTDADLAGIDDVGFIGALIDYFVANHKADPKRVYVMGMSNGSMMTNRLGCELSDKIAAIGAVGGTMPELISMKCDPGRRVPAMMFHGTEDGFAPFDGGEVSKGSGGVVLSAVNTAAKWAQINGCASTPTVESMPDVDPEDGATVRKEEYKNCADGSETVLFVVEGGGHTWPGGWQYLGEALIGVTTKDVVATELLLEFFDRHSR